MPQAESLHTFQNDTAFRTAKGGEKIRTDTAGEYQTGVELAAPALRLLIVGN
jgi:hypothetical protein